MNYTLQRATNYDDEWWIYDPDLNKGPAGFDRTHEFVEDLKRKNLYTGAEFTEREVVAGDFLDRYVALCEQSAPLLEFLTRALGLRW